MVGRRAWVWGEDRKPSELSLICRTLLGTVGDSITRKLANQIAAVNQISDKIQTACSSVRYNNSRAHAPGEYWAVLHEHYLENQSPAPRDPFNPKSGAERDLIFLRKYQNDSEVYNRLLKIRETFFEHLN